MPRGCGATIFSGASAALRGGAGFANLAVPKFGLRALSPANFGQGNFAPFNAAGNLAPL